MNIIDKNEVELIKNYRKYITKSISLEQLYVLIPPPEKYKFDENIIKEVKNKLKNIKEISNQELYDLLPNFTEKGLRFIMLEEFNVRLSKPKKHNGKVQRVYNLY